MRRNRALTAEVEQLDVTLRAHQHATYRLVFEVNHTNGSVTFEIGANGLSPAPDEFWGIDNVRVTVSH